MTIKEKQLAGFIEKAKAIHGDKYAYDKVDYKTLNHKVIITCLIHGDFLQNPDTHIRQGSGCPKCARDKRRMSLDTFLARANTIHKNKYDYSKVEWEHLHKKIIVICPIHGEFVQKPEAHLNEAGCPDCGRLQASETKKIKS